MVAKGLMHIIVKQNYYFSFIIIIQEIKENFAVGIIDNNVNLC